MIWAFKPSDLVDIRRFPREDARAIDEEIARLGGEAAPAQAAAPEGPEASRDEGTPG